MKNVFVNLERHEEKTHGILNKYDQFPPVNIVNLIFLET